jgi:chemotaxis protein methyltransferase CheR
MIGAEAATEIPAKVLTNPALLYLYHRIEQILGIKAESDSLIKLNAYLEKCCGASFIENPAAHEHLLTSRERIFEISDLLTVNETYFFREGVHFDLLARFLPELAKLKRPIQICSAATSIGCEAYSIAMLLDYHAKNGPGFDFAVDAFDVSAEAIETAKNGRYTANTLRADGAAWKYILDSYLVPDGGEYVVSHNIRGKVRFFPHNIMRGLDRQYDVIFFRNALIYFSSKNRIVILNDLADSLFSGGFLFLGITETSSARHPLLESRCLSDAFYFQKSSDANNSYKGTSKCTHAIEAKVELASNLRFAAQRNKSDQTSAPLRENLKKKYVSQPKMELTIDCGETAEILGTEEGQPNAKKTLKALEGIKALESEKETHSSETTAFPSGAELAASALYFLGVQDFDSADRVLSVLEKSNTGAFTRFLRGEYHFLRGSAKDAERYFEEAAGKEKAFWPAFYRIASLAAQGNPARYAYKIKKACESLELGMDFRYECFLGGFSPDYYRRILSKKLS